VFPPRLLWSASREERKMKDLVVIGAGGGVLAALRAAELGARTVLLTSGEFGGMAANDGPVPVRCWPRARGLFAKPGS